MAPHRATVWRTAAALAETLREATSGEGRGGSGGDVVDQTNDIATRESMTILATRGSNEMQDLHDTLARLRKDPAAFGYCHVCAEPIGFARLEAVPTTRHCKTHARQG
jgi:RNA polymerase-binding transcription factor DksA